MRTTDLDCLVITFLYPVVEHFFLLRIIMSANLTKLLRRKIETFYTRSHYLNTKLRPQDPSTPKPKNTKRKNVYRREANVLKVCGVLYKVTFWSVDEIAIFRERTPSGECVTCLHSLSIFKLFTSQTNRWCGFDLCNIIYLTRIPSYIILIHVRIIYIYI